MKKVLLSALFALCLAVSAYAQPRAIGGRIGMGVEVSYQHSMGEKNMVEVELGMPWYLGVQASATYDWIFNIKSWNGAGKWNWYAGVGASVGYIAHLYREYHWNYTYPIHWIGGGIAGVAGRIGVEYVFDNVPLVLSVDYRPVIGAAFWGACEHELDAQSGAAFYTPGLYDFAVSARYIF